MVAALHWGLLLNSDANGKIKRTNSINVIRNINTDFEAADGKCYAYMELFEKASFAFVSICCRHASQSPLPSARLLR